MLKTKAKLLKVSMLFIFKHCQSYIG